MDPSHPVPLPVPPPPPSNIAHPAGACARSEAFRCHGLQRRGRGGRPRHQVGEADLRSSRGAQGPGITQAVPPCRRAALPVGGSSRWGLTDLLRPADGAGGGSQGGPGLQWRALLFTKYFPTAYTYLAAAATTASSRARGSALAIIDHCPGSLGRGGPRGGDGYSHRCGMCWVLK